MSRGLRAIEFFSGIGAFAYAAQNFPISIVAAFDQSSAANYVYSHNFGRSPKARNLDGIKSSEIPAADLWWMSPPCTPFSRRGKRKDVDDPRAISFLNLIDCIPSCQPQKILVENVQGFPGSVVHRYLLETLKRAHYFTREITLCPTYFGVPMKRPRYFMAASRTRFSTIEPPRRSSLTPLSAFLESDGEPELQVDGEILARYADVLNLVNPSDPQAVLICFTSNYSKCHKASGSLLSPQQGPVRRVSPDEILRLLGFAIDYHFPIETNLPTRWRLVGNSVDVRSISYLLTLIA